MSIDTQIRELLSRPGVRIEHALADCLVLMRKHLDAKIWRRVFVEFGPGRWFATDDIQEIEVATIGAEEGLAYVKVRRIAGNWTAAGPMTIDEAHRLAERIAKGDDAAAT